MSRRFPNVIDQYINVDGQQVNAFSLRGCSYTYRFSGYGQNVSFALNATAGAGYKFDHWQFTPEHPFDDISSPSLFAEIHEDWDPYRIVAIAYFVSTSPPPQTDSAINLTLVSDPVGVGALIGGGLRSGAVGSSTTYGVIADVLEAQKTRYAFSHWTDDQNVRHNEKSFSKSFVFKAGYSVSNPEQISFVAHFRPCTGLILRSATSGKILRGNSSLILRDE